jgi:hypothetical protein
MNDSSDNAAPDDTFVGSMALLTALHDTYVEHIGVAEADGPSGPYVWCACGWRSDDLPGGPPGASYAVHLTNAQHAAAVKALQPIVRRIRPAATTCTDYPAPITCLSIDDPMPCEPCSIRPEAKEES